MNNTWKVMTKMIGVSSAFLIILTSRASVASTWQVQAGMSMDDYHDSQQQMLIIGDSGPDVKKYKVKLDRKTTVAIAQYNNHFAAIYAQKPTHGLITVVYEQNYRRAIASTANGQCQRQEGLAWQLGCAISEETYSLTALR